MTYSIFVQCLVYNNCSVYVTYVENFTLSPRFYYNPSLWFSLFCEWKQRDTQGIQPPPQIVSVTEIKKKNSKVFSNSCFSFQNFKKLGPMSGRSSVYFHCIKKRTRVKIPSFSNFISDSFPWVLTLKQNGLIWDVEEIRRSCLLTYCNSFIKLGYINWV